MPLSVGTHLKQRTCWGAQVCLGEYLDGCADGAAACPCCQRPLSVDLSSATPVCLPPASCHARMRLLEGAWH